MIIFPEHLTRHLKIDNRQGPHPSYKKLRTLWQVEDAVASGLENARLVPKAIGRAAARTCFIQNAVEHVPWTWTNTVHCNTQMHYKSL